MFVRESPTSARPSGDTQWPPKSPHDALRNSPSRQKRLKQERTRNSTSPSLHHRRNSRFLQSEVSTQYDPEEEDEDEETLQLQLQALQARLKLKKLQNAKQKPDPRSTKQTPLENRSADRREPSRPEAAVEPSKHISQPVVQVPQSPKRQSIAPKAPESPRRVQLGIDKGLRATDVSLGKARSGRESGRTHVPKATPKQTKSFGARLQEARSQDNSREQRQERIQNGRRRGFGISLETDERRNCDADEKTDKKYFKSPPASSSAKPGVMEPSSAHILASNDENSVRDAWSGFQLSKRILPESKASEALSEKQIISIPDLLKTVTAPQYDPPDTDDDYVVVGIIASKSTPFNHASKHKIASSEPEGESSANQRSKFMVIKLTNLKWELDVFLFDTGFERFWKLTVGTVIAILNPAIMPPKPHMRDTGAFSLKITSSEDTVLELGVSQDLAFCKAIKKDGKECSQWIDKRRTEFCEFHVNIQVEKARANRMEINGMNSAYGLFGRQSGNPRTAGSGGSGVSHGRGWKGAGKQSKEDGLLKEGRYYDKQAHEMAYIVPKEFSSRGPNSTTASLLDAEDYLDGGRLSAQERSRRRLAAQEKERELARQLAGHGGGVGSEYMHRKGQDDDSRESAKGAEGTRGPQNHSADDPANAESLGLVGTKQNITLSPVKGGRLGSKATSAGVGWSSAFKRGLPEQKVNEKAAREPQVEHPDDRKSKRPSQNATTPASKKARFMIEDKGIRIPGRESLSHSKAEVRPSAQRAVDDNDDDGLDIV